MGEGPTATDTSVGTRRRNQPSISLNYLERVGPPYRCPHRPRYRRSLFVSFTDSNIQTTGKSCHTLSRETQQPRRPLRPWTEVLSRFLDDGPFFDDEDDEEYDTESSEHISSPIHPSQLRWCTVGAVDGPRTNFPGVHTGTELVLRGLGRGGGGEGKERKLP